MAESEPDEGVLLLGTLGRLLLLLYPLKVKQRQLLLQQALVLVRCSSDPPLTDGERRQLMLKNALGESC